MPYIPSKRRGERPETAGELNYALHQVISHYLKGKADVGYFEFNQVVGVLESVKLELYRRLIGPYEDRKIKENGDVHPYDWLSRP